MVVQQNNLNNFIYFSNAINIQSHIKIGLTGKNALIISNAQLETISRAEIREKIITCFNKRKKQFDCI